MTTHLSTLLLVSDGSPGWIERATAQIPHRDVHVVVPGAANLDPASLPDGWVLLKGADVGNQEQLREAFLRFLEEWPCRPLLGDRSFEDLFRQADGYSVWWTGPGIDRNPNAGIFVELQTLWAADHAIRRYAPAKVFISCRSSELTAVLESRCARSRLPYEVLDGSARLRLPAWEGRIPWLMLSLRRALSLPARVTIRALVARLTARTGPHTGQPAGGPVVVFTSQFSRSVRIAPEGVSVWFWQALCGQLSVLVPHVRCCHLLRLGREIPGYRAVSFFYHTAWPLLRRLNDVVPPREHHPAIGAWLRSLPRQLLALWRYARIETQPGFRESFTFAGADLAPMYAPRLREAVAGICEWAQTVGATTKSLNAVGNVRAIVVYEEMYRPGMINIAAARAAAIPTVGVQHGMIMPAHMMYTLPRGQVLGAPIPDHFAATSEYAREVLVRHGAYPADRIWITGSPRFDGLINNPPDRQEARRRLDLPHDKRIVLVTTQTAAWFPAAVRSVFEAVKDRTDLIVCVKTHPKTLAASSDVYRSIARDVGATNVRCFDDRFDELLAACNVLVSGWSTTILEATLLGRRTVCLNFAGETPQYPYVEDGASVAARSPKEVGSALEMVLSPSSSERLDEGRRRFLERHAGPSAQGIAGRTLATRILTLACPEELTTRHPEGLAVPDRVTAGLVG